MILPEKVTIIEVGPRDGLQNEKSLIPTDVKKTFISKLKAAGFRAMELSSFVSPKWVPQMADAEEIVVAFASTRGKNYVLVPNKRGIERLRKTGIRDAAIFIGVSDTFNKKNINKTTGESIEELAPLVNDLKKDGYFIRACVSTAFYCPYEGRVEEDRTIALCRTLAEMGADELSVADTIGMATPKEVYHLFTRLKDEFPHLLITAHFHDTRKMGLANVLAALQAGVDRFDCSAGGIGGCPFAPGAAGNVATEDVVYMLERMGIETGVDLEVLADAITFLQPYLNRPPDSAYFKTRK